MPWPGIDGMDVYVHMVVAVHSQESMKLLCVRVHMRVCVCMCVCVCV